MNLTTDGLSNGMSDEHLPLYILAGIVTLVAFGYFVIGVYRWISLFVVVTLGVAVVGGAALAVKLGGGYVVSIFLGVLPGYGFVIADPYVYNPEGTPLYLDMISVVLIFSIFFIPLATIGFLAGVLWRYWGEVRRRKYWIASRVGISVVLTGVVFLLVQYDGINYGASL